MKNYLLILALVTVFAACKGKKSSKEEPAISALSIIKGQLNHLDTSLYQVTKYETADARTDTSYMKREEVRKYAAPFLSLPDIADKKYKDRYSEEKLIEAERQMLSITSTAKDENEEIQKQIIFIGLDDINSGKVQSIYVDRYITSGDSTVEQQLFWVIDKLFSVQNIIEKEGRPGKIHSTKVAWQ